MLVCPSLTFSKALYPCLLGRNKAEANVVEADRVVGVVAGRRPAVGRKEVPATAAINAVRSLTTGCDVSWASRVGLGATWVVVIPITAPFPYIAMHVIQAISIWSKTAYFCAMFTVKS